MSAESTSRQRYSQAFVLLLLGGLLFIMVSSSLVGVSDFENNLILKNLLIEKANWLRLKIRDRVFPNVHIGKAAGDDDIQVETPKDENHFMKLMAEANKIADLKKRVATRAKLSELWKAKRNEG